MIINEKQIMQLITIAHAHLENCKTFCEYNGMREVQDLLATINDQQAEELKDIK